MVEPVAHLIQCPSCGQPTELPFLFCDHCGMPRVRLGHWRLVLNLSFAFLTFTVIYLAKDFLAWAWPLYMYLWIFYIQFGLMLMAGRAWLKMRLFLWNIVFFLVFFVMFHFMQATDTPDFLFFFLSPGQPLAPDFMLAVLGSLPGFAREAPLFFFSGLAAIIVIIFGLSYLNWGRKYGWVNAYRIVILSLLTICMTLLAGIHLAERLYQSHIWPNVDWQGLLKAKSDYDEYLGTATLFLFRLFVTEIVVYSAFHSYAVVHRKPMPMPELAAGESALVRSLLRLVVILQRLYKVLEQMFMYLLGTLWQLLCDMALVGKAFMRELALPTISLIATALMFYALMKVTMAYIETDQVSDIGWIVALLGGTLFSLMVFVACKTPYRWKRVLSFYGEMLAWLLPNLMVFFLLMSLSLWMTSKFLSHNPALPPLPYHAGLLTEILSIVMIVMVAVILVRKRSLISKPPEAVPVAAGVVAAMKPAKQPRKWGSLLGLNRVAEKAKHKAEDLGLDSHALKAKALASDAAGFLKDRIQGKPLVVDKLDRATERLQAKLAQVTSLSNMQASVDPHTYERLMTQYRGEYAALKAEREQALIEYRRILDRRNDELTGLRVEADQVARRKTELDALLEVGALNESDYRREVKAVEAEARTVETKIEMCRTIIDSMATESAK